MLNLSTSRRAAPALRLRGVVVGKCIKPNAFGNALGSSLAEANSGTRIDKTKPLTAADIGQWNGATAQDLVSSLPAVNVVASDANYSPIPGSHAEFMDEWSSGMSVPDGEPDMIRPGPNARSGNSLYRRGTQIPGTGYYSTGVVSQGQTMVEVSGVAIPANFPAGTKAVQYDDHISFLTPKNEVFRIVDGVANNVPLNPSANSDVPVQPVNSTPQSIVVKGVRMTAEQKTAYDLEQMFPSFANSQSVASSNVNATVPQSLPMPSNETIGGNAVDPIRTVVPSIEQRPRPIQNAIAIRDNNRVAPIAMRDNQLVQPRFANTANRNAVSDHSVRILNDLGRTAGVDVRRLMITSTMRTPEDQARIMYGQLRNGTLSRYGAPGRDVVNVYRNGVARGNTPAEVREQMTNRIQDYLDRGVRVSNHLGDAETLNVFDIAPSSIPRRQITAFERALDEAVRAGVINLYHGPHTRARDPAYHLEIPQP